MSRTRKVLYWLWAIAMAASFNGWLVWLYPDAMHWNPWHKPPFPFIGLDAGKDDGFKEIRVRIRPIPVPVPVVRPLTVQRIVDWHVCQDYCTASTCVGEVAREAKADKELPRECVFCTHDANHRMWIGPWPLTP